MNSSAGSNPPPDSEYFQPGEVLAGRFKIDNFLGVEVIGESYLAEDQSENRKVAVTTVPARFVRGANIQEKIKAEIKTASRAVHKNVLTCYGMGSLTNGSLYITTQYIEGQKLYSILQKRQQGQKHFTLRGAYNIIAHVANGMAEVHKTRVHGSLSPFSIRISSAGRVKIADLPLSRLYYMFPAMRKEIPEYVQKFWAPEVLKIGSFVTERADIYSLGVVLFELLTTVLPQEGLSPRMLREDLPESIDEIIARCLDPDPASRWNSMQALSTALLRVTEESEKPQEETSQDDLLMDLEIDIDKPMMKPPPPPPPSPGAGHQGRPAAPAASPVPAFGVVPPPPAQEPAASPPPGGVASILDLVDQEASAKAGSKPEGKPAGASKISLDEIMASLEDQDAEKWMVTRDGLDHGPFRTREVVQMIMRWEIEGQHAIQDLDSGIRVKLRESPQFKELVERAKVEKQRKEEIEALAKSEKAEKRGGVAKVFIVIAVLGGIGVIIGGYFLTRAAVQAFTGGGQEVNLAEDYKIDVGKGGILQDGGKKGKGGKRKGGIPAGMSYEEYMAMGVDIGDLGADGGQMQLTQGQINAVMSSQGKKVYPCIYAELKKNSSLKKVALKFAIDGKTGRVAGVSVTSGGSSELQSCLSSKMKSIQFPTFGAPRMGATFYFDVN
jgi:serine/threonine protein kinase